MFFKYLHVGFCFVSLLFRALSLLRKVNDTCARRNRISQIFNESATRLTRTRCVIFQRPFPTTDAALLYAVELRLLFVGKIRENSELGLPNYVAYVRYVKIKIYTLSLSLSLYSFKITISVKVLRM